MTQPPPTLIRKVILHDVGDNFYQVTWLYEQNGAQVVHTFPKQLGHTALVNIEALLASGYPVEPSELLEDLRCLYRSAEKGQQDEPDASNPELEQHVLKLFKRVAALLTVSEVAARLKVSTSRIHNRIAQDKALRPRKRHSKIAQSKELQPSGQYFPSARLATREEVAALVLVGRLKVWTPKGVTVIQKRDVDALQGKL